MGLYSYDSRDEIKFSYQNFINISPIKDQVIKRSDTISNVNQKMMITKLCEKLLF